MKFRKTAAAILAATMAVSALSVGAFAEENKIKLMTAEIPAELATSMVYFEGVGLVDLTGEKFDSSENSYADKDANLDVDFDGIGYVSEENLEAWRETGVLTFNKLKKDFDTTGLKWGMFDHSSEYIQLVKMEGDEVVQRGLYQITEGEVKKLCDLGTYWTSTRKDGVSVGLERIDDTIHFKEITTNWETLEQTETVSDIDVSVETKLVITQPDGTKKEIPIGKSNITDKNIAENEQWMLADGNGNTGLYSVDWTISTPSSGDTLATVMNIRDSLENIRGLGGSAYEIIRYNKDGSSKKLYGEIEQEDYATGSYIADTVGFGNDYMWLTYNPVGVGAQTLYRYVGETGKVEIYGDDEGEEWVSANENRGLYMSLVPKSSEGNLFIADLQIEGYVNEGENKVIEGYAIFNGFDDLKNWNTKTLYKKLSPYNIGTENEKKCIYKYETKDGKLGFMDGTEKVLGEFDAIGGFEGKYSPVVKGGKAYLVDKNMNVVSEQIDADSVVAVSDNIFIVNKGDKKYFTTFESGEAGDTPSTPDKPSTPAVLVDYSDDTTGIKAAANEGVLENGAKLSVAAVADKTNDKNFTYEISFKKDDKNVQPNGKVTVKIPIPEAIKDKTIFVYRVEDGKYYNMGAKIENGFVVFETDHFSEYLVTTEKREDAVKPSVPGKNPATGIAGGMFGIMAIAGAFVIVSKKRR